MHISLAARGKGMKKRLLFMVMCIFLAAVCPAGCTAQRQSSAENPGQVSAGQETELSEERSEVQELERTEQPDEAEEQSVKSAEGEEEMKMNVRVGERTFTATLEDNEAAAALVQMMESEPVVIEMNDYAGFEKVGALGTSLPASDRQTTTQAGDIVLYQGNQIVIFYGSNSWSYTRLGKIDDLDGWEDALGNGDVTVTFELP